MVLLALGSTRRDSFTNGCVAGVKGCDVDDATVVPASAGRDVVWVVAVLAGTGCAAYEL